MDKETQASSKYDRLGYLVALIPGLLAIYLITLIPMIMRGEHLTVTYPWVPSLGVEFSFLVDGLSLVFGLIITIIGALVILYAGSYLAGHPQLKRFYIFILLFMVAMLGVVFSQNLITLFVFWELTSISSFLLIGFYHEKKSSRKAALQALLVTGGGGLLLLVGIFILGLVAGNYDLVVLFTKAGLIQESPFYGAILILFCWAPSPNQPNSPFTSGFPEPWKRLHRSVLICIRPQWSKPEFT